MATLRQLLRHLFRSGTSRQSSASPKPRWYSVSSTREYETCPRRYQFAYVDRVPTDRGLAPEGWRFGTVVHRGLEAAYRQHQAVGDSPDLTHTVPVALEAVREAWASEQMPDDPAARGRAEEVVRRSLVSTCLEPADILGVEHHFRAETPDGCRISGFADLVLRRGDFGIEIRDHKVTRHLCTPEQLTEDFQLNLYGWLALQEWPWAHAISASHHYPLGGELAHVDLDETNMEAAVLRVRTVASRAEADAEFVPMPGEHCESCVWSSLCPEALSISA